MYRLGSKRRAALEMVSLESDLRALKVALAHEHLFDHLIPWKPAIAALIAQGEWKGDRLHWRLLQGDAALRMKQVEGKFDLICFDPFSPTTSPQLWRQEFIAAIADQLDPDGLCVTSEASFPARAAFLKAKLFVGVGFANGKNKETTVAAHSISKLVHPLDGSWLKRWERATLHLEPGGHGSQDTAQSVLRHPQFMLGCD